MFKTITKYIFSVLFIFTLANNINASCLLDIEYLNSIFINSSIPNSLKSSLYKEFKGFILSNENSEIAHEIIKFNMELDIIEKESYISNENIKMAKSILLFNWYNILNSSNINNEILKNEKDFIEQLKNKKITSISLKYLYLGHLNARKVAEGLILFKDLTDLDISYNNLKTEGLEKFLNILPNLENLAYLNISNNDFEPKSHNEIYSMAKSIESCKNLISLDISYNKINSVGSKILSNTLKNLHNLSKLIMIGCDFTLDDIAIITKHFTELNNLKELNISNNSLRSTSPEHSKLFIEIFNNIKNLSNLNITNCFLNIFDMQEISSVLSNFNNLISFRISNNKLNHQNDSGIFMIIKALKSCKNLKIISISNNKISFNSISALCETLKNLPNLKLLDISSNNIEISQITNILDSILIPENLTELDISKNCLESSKFGNIEKLGKILKRFKSLIKLNISSCELKFKDALQISKIISIFNDLTYFNISYNKMQYYNDCGIVSILKALENCEKLTSLDISHNNIGLYGVAALCSLLNKLPNVSLLNISSCSLKKTSISIINNTIIDAPNIKLNHLNISQITDHPDIHCIQYFRSLITLLNNEKVKHLEISSNSLHDEKLELLRKLFYKKGKILRLK